MTGHLRYLRLGLVVIVAAGVLVWWGRARLADDHPDPIAPGSIVTMDGQAFKLRSPGKWYSYQGDPRCARFEVHHDERFAGDVTNHPDDDRQRAELAATRRYPIGTTLWAAFDMRVTGSVSETWRGGFVNLIQMHQAPEAEEPGKPPPFSIQITPQGQLVVLTRSDRDRVTSTAPPATTRHSETWRDAGKVVRFVYRITFGPVGGNLRVWKDGKRIVDLDQLPLGYNDRSVNSRPLLAFGIYRSNAASPLVTEVCNVQYGTKPLTERIRRPIPWDS